MAASSLRVPCSPHHSFDDVKLLQFTFGTLGLPELLLAFVTVAETSEWIKRARDIIISAGAQLTARSRTEAVVIAAGAASAAAGRSPLLMSIAWEGGGGGGGVASAAAMSGSASPMPSPYFGSLSSSPVHHRPSRDRVVNEEEAHYHLPLQPPSAGDATTAAIAPATTTAERATTPSSSYTTLDVMKAALDAWKRRQSHGDAPVRSHATLVVAEEEGTDGATAAAAHDSRRLPSSSSLSDKLIAWLVDYRIPRDLTIGDMHGVVRWWESTATLLPANDLPPPGSTDVVVRAWQFRRFLASAAWHVVLEERALDPPPPPPNTGSFFGSPSPR